MTEIQIRNLTIEDIPAALEILDQSNRLHARNDPEFFVCVPKEYSRPYLENILRNPQSFGLVAVDKNQVVGILLAGRLTREGEIYKNRTFLKVHDLAVHQDFKKRGIGRKLLENLEKTAQELKIPQIDLEVFSFNCNAYEFYKKLNFREVSRIMSLNVDIS